ncbi:MAG: class SAM-dependent methyltransferase [Verrucomicrobiales bacterium]|nr:class SAM-dependent methyltransferase [Verrucomicrobiales bacterium]
MSNRQVQPELLDDLPPTQREARASRRDLQRINWLMGHVGTFQKAWFETGANRWSSRIVDLGGGDGTLLLRFVRNLQPKPQSIILIDRQPVISPETLKEFEKLGCKTEVEAVDVFGWLEKSSPVSGTLLITNLFLHHFQQEDLRNLLRLISRQCQAFVACEPRRADFALVASHLLGLIGCNGVTRHDAVISVRAGFRGSELTALWPSGPDWTTCERRAGLFSHRFSATKKRS